MTRGHTATCVAGLLAVLCAGAGCTSASQAATGTVIHIEIHHSRFVPATISVGEGQTVRFVVHNSDPIDHEFIVGDQATQDRHEHGVDDHHDGSVPGEISVPASTVVTTTYHFGPPGQIFYGCHLPGHWAYGMHGVIRVAA
ncbi:MAG: cupredoxin domain-containing protein [Acidimicrobiia bacterium]|nr:cupredoxin domain-containing protein [Acidimicrobiia bacterium]MBV8303906.1 cupredoxin domain-containing protein [Acidimicrobiia bacterium]